MNASMIFVRGRGAPQGFSGQEVPEDPLALFASWSAARPRGRGLQGDGAVLVAAGAEGRAAVLCTRVVQVPDGFACFLPTGGEMGLALAAEPAVSLSFDWSEQGRAVTARGRRCHRLSALDEDAFFGGLPERVQLAAWSATAPREGVTRTELEQSATECADRFAGQLIPRPNHWGGYRVPVDEMRFHQESDDCVPDCFHYRRADGEQEWTVVRSSP